MTPLPSLAAHIAERRDQIVETMLELRDRDLEAPPAEARQFLSGYLNLIAAAAAGDTGPRDEYLATVIPGVRAAGIPFEATLDSLLRASMALISELDAEHHRWAGDFCGDYARRLMRAWLQDGVR